MCVGGFGGCGEYRRGNDHAGENPARVDLVSIVPGECRVYHACETFLGVVRDGADSSFLCPIAGNVP